MSIYKAYDLRGTVPDQLHPRLARAIGNAYAGLLEARTLVLGRDMRTHSDELAEATAEGILEAGCDVVDVGRVTTPMSYFAVGRLGHDGGMMVTASHNGPEWNGYKLCRRGAVPVSEDTGIRDLERRVGEGDYRRVPRKGRREARDVRADYVRHVLGFAAEARSALAPLTVVVDGGNGMAGVVVEEVLRGLPVKLVPLYLEPDGRFPNHEANPIKAANLEDLRREVRARGADLGVAFDGDADRVGFVDEKGAICPCDLVTALVAQEVLRREPGSGVLYDLRSSKVVRETILAGGGRPVEERVGHSFMKATMRRLDLAFGGELSGHYYFRENYYADSAMIAMVRVLNALAAGRRPFSEVLAPLRRYHATGEVNFEVRDKDAAIEALVRAFAGGEVSRLDGVTVRFTDWWFNVRRSNTEPLLRLNLEGDTAEAMEAGRRRVLEVLGATPTDS
ncbi:MAG: phosphomannomutase/phosphoglucomutase [Planctomycetes bacterium]|nr:phosphomannomutase/phosphoglucomutase [Planctomycetota bacterium]